MLKARAFLFNRNTDVELDLSKGGVQPYQTRPIIYVKNRAVPTVQTLTPNAPAFGVGCNELLWGDYITYVPTRPLI